MSTNFTVIKEWRAKRGAHCMKLGFHVLDADYGPELAGRKSYLLQETWKKGVTYPGQGLGLDADTAAKKAAYLASLAGLVEHVRQDNWNVRGAA